VVLSAALAVGVLDAQDEAPAARAPKQEAEQRRAGVTRMQVARRARRESRDDGRFHAGTVYGIGRAASRAR
jgi:hypothetical protein